MPEPLEGAVRSALSVVIPVRNESPNVRPLFDEICAALNGVVDYEVLFVDDGSSDDTAHQLLELSKSFPQLRVVRHARSCGQSTAVRSGVRAAKNPWIATLDGDGQNDPADIPKLLEVLRTRSTEAPQIVCGYRRKRRDTWLKRISSKVANGVRSRFLSDSTPDTGCGLKVFQRGMFLALPYFDHMHRFLPALVQREGGKVVSVEVNHRPRTRGTSNYGMFDRLWVGIVDMFGVMWLIRRSHRPQILDVEKQYE